MTRRLAEMVLAHFLIPSIASDGKLAVVFETQ
jgi:hypothetical protein